MDGLVWLRGHFKLSTINQTMNQKICGQVDKEDFWETQGDRFKTSVGTSTHRLSRPPYYLACAWWCDMLDGWRGFWTTVCTIFSNSCQNSNTTSLNLFNSFSSWVVTHPFIENKRSCCLILKITRNHLLFVNRMEDCTYYFMFGQLKKRQIIRLTSHSKFEFTFWTWFTKTFDSYISLKHQLYPFSINIYFSSV